MILSGRVIGDRFIMLGSIGPYSECITAGEGVLYVAVLGLVAFRAGIFLSCSECHRVFL